MPRESRFYRRKQAQSRPRYPFCSIGTRWQRESGERRSHLCLNAVGAFFFSQGVASTKQAAGQRTGRATIELPPQRTAELVRAGPVANGQADYVAARVPKFFTQCICGQEKGCMISCRGVRAQEAEQLRGKDKARAKSALDADDAGHRGHGTAEYLLRTHCDMYDACTPSASIPATVA